MCVLGVVSRRCIGNNKWEETIGCFNEEAENLLNQVMTVSLFHVQDLPGFFRLRISLHHWMN